MHLKEDWNSCVVEADNGHLVFVTCRAGLDKMKASGKFGERVEIYWRYVAAPGGMPVDADGEMLGTILALLQNAMEHDLLAVLTGVYTGDGTRTIVFYTRSGRRFGERLNNALADQPQLPITLYVERDPEWLEYAETQKLMMQEKV